MTGTIVPSPGAGQVQELQVDSLEILGECNPDVGLICFLCARSLMLV